MRRRLCHPYIVIAALALFSTALVGGLSQHSPAAARDGLDRVVEWRPEVGGNGNSYEVVATGGFVLWSDARRAAEERGPGAHLATIASEEENEFVHALASDPAFWSGRSGPWLGGFQAPGSPEPDEGWQWVTGEPFSFANWAPSEPSNSGGDPENFLHFWVSSLGSSTWNDATEECCITSYVIDYEHGAGTPVLCAGRSPTLSGAGNIRGTDGDDVIAGSNGPDRIEGLGGDDQICGLGGDDVLIGGEGDDALLGGA